MKLTKTETEIKAEKELKEVQKKERRKFKSLATRVKNNCSEIGLNTVELQLEFIKKNNTILPEKAITRDRNIEAIELGIKMYKESYFLK